MKYEFDFDGAPAAQPVDEDVVRALETLLVRARSGEIVGIAVAAALANKGFATTWESNASLQQQLGCAISYLQVRYYNKMGACE